MSNGAIIEVFAKKSEMSEFLFNLLGDLAAETWYKVASRWNALSKPPLHFTSDAIPYSNASEKKVIHLYEPVDLKSSTDDQVLESKGIDRSIKFLRNCPLEG